MKLTNLSSRDSLIKRITQRLRFLDIKNYTIRDGGIIDVDGDVYMRYMRYAFDGLTIKERKDIIDTSNLEVAGRIHF